MIEEKIRVRILLPLAVALLVLTIAIIVSFYNYKYLDMEHEFSIQINSVNGLFKGELKHDASLMGGLIDFLKVDPCLQQNFQAHDRTALLQCAESIFLRLQDKHRVTHFYFHTADKINFLRVHNATRHGDSINRFTLQGAHDSDSPFSGIELGPLGTFTLRTVHPWHVDGELIGYIELGEEIGHITSKLKEITSLDLFFLIEKQFLKREGWEEGLQMMGQNGNWGQLEQFVVIDQTSTLWSEEIQSFLKLNHTHVTADSSKATEGFVAMDFGERQVMRGLNKMCLIALKNCCMPKNAQKKPIWQNQTFLQP